MKILLAEDDALSRRRLAAILGKWGYEVVVTTNGEEAWQVMQHQAGFPTCSFSHHSSHFLLLLFIQRGCCFWLRSWTH